MIDEVYQREDHYNHSNNCQKQLHPVHRPFDDSVNRTFIAQALVFLLNLRRSAITGHHQLRDQQRGRQRDERGGDHMTHRLRNGFRKRRGVKDQDGAADRRHRQNHDLEQFCPAHLGKVSAHDQRAFNHAQKHIRSA